MTAIDQNKVVAEGPTCDPSRTCDQIELGTILTSIGEAAYLWDIETDRICWSESGPALLQVSGHEVISTGSKIGRLFKKKFPNSLHRTIMNSTEVDNGDGVAYETEYPLMPNGRSDSKMLWLSDTGRWFAGPDGKPKQAHGLIRIVTERHEREQNLAYLSRTDELTGQMNRSTLSETLDDTLESAIRCRTGCAFLIVAIDNLAVLNDSYGFDKADEVIREVGKRLQRRLRGGDKIGRFSGNKFGIVLANCLEPDMAVATKRLMSAVRDLPIETSAGPISVTISTGGVVLPRYANTAQKAMICAQEALNAAKADHRDSFVNFSQSNHKEVTRKKNIQIADKIISALNEGRVKLHYQPIVSSVTEQPEFYECLVRIMTPDGKLAGAGAFIPTAEKLGLMRLIDHRVLDLATASLVEYPDVNLAINISAATAMDIEWLDHLRAHVQLNPDIARRMIVEITETTMIDDVQESVRFVEALHDLGCRVAIDDFGAGYTSFRNLKLLEVDMVKLDGAFVENLSSDYDNQFFVKTLIDLAKNFGMATVAEWVESEQDASLLKSWDVEFMQGFLYGKPMSSLPMSERRIDVSDDEETAEATPEPENSHANSFSI